MSESLLIEKTNTHDNKKLEKMIFITSILTVVIIIVETILIISLSNEAVHTLNDVQEIVPEVKQALKMLEDLCKHEPINQYCWHAGLIRVMYEGTAIYKECGAI